MFLAEPPRTQFDLNFQAFGFPVRVHPFFWLITLLLGLGGSGEDRGTSLIIWLVAVFVSILVHELGHALMIRRFGRDAYIVLYAMGGLAIEGRPRSYSDFGSPWSLDSYSSFQPRPRLPREQIIISAAGPGIQFAFALALTFLIYGSGGFIRFSGGPLPLPLPVFGSAWAENENLALLLVYLFYINTFWPLVNLLPVLPLDGGQIAMQLLVQQDPWQGAIRALWLSVIAGGIAAVLCLIVLRDQFLMLLFASLAVSSYLTLLQSGGGRRPW